MAPPNLPRKINGPEPALLIDRAGTVIAANHNLSRLLRMSSTEILGKPLRTFVSDDCENLTRYLWRCSRNSEGASGRLTILPLGGQSIICRVVGRWLRAHRNQTGLLCLRLLTRVKAPFTESDPSVRGSDEKGARHHADKRWQTAFESAAVGIVMADLKGRCFAANSAFRNSLGYTEQELYQLNFQDITYPEDGEAGLPFAGELVEGKPQPFEIEQRCCRKDGSSFWARQHFALVPGETGVPPFWFGIVEDVTERKRVEEELERQKRNFQDSEARLQAFFDNSPNLIFMKDREGRYLYVNKQFKRALRVTEQQVIGKRDNEIFSREQAAAFQANDRQVLTAGIPMEFEEAALEEDGSHTSIVHKFPLFNAAGETYAIGGIVTDITERKKEESARRLSEERYRVVVETANDAVLSTDETGAIVIANSATSKIFGYDSAELIGKPLTMLMPGFSRQTHENGFTRYSETGAPQINWQGTELVGLHRNGKEFPVELSLGESTLSGQRMFTAFIRDITERKQAEEMRTAAVEFLTKSISDRDLLEAIRIALQRHRNSQEQEERAAEFRRRFELLTPREQEVISMVVSGMLNKEISSELGTSENTVKVHRSRAMEKMQARSLPDMVRMMEQLKGFSEEAP